MNLGLLKLVRHAYLPDATLGRLYVEELALATLEEPWVRNPFGPGGQKKTQTLHESCVPDGLYDLVPHSGQRFQSVWALVSPEHGIFHWPGEIPMGARWGRSAILIHAGNDTGDIEGCIAVGLAHSGNGVADSHKALELLRVKLGTQPHRLLIRPLTGTSELLQ